MSEKMEALHEEEHPLNPPGGLMIWIFIIMELLVFGAALLAFLYVRKGELKVFVEAQKHLSVYFGLLNTFALISSGYLIALANRAFEVGDKGRTLRYLWMGMVLGGAFLVIKGIEYSQKIAGGFTTGVNAFFDFYWLLTAFHAAHVVVGLFLLMYMAWKIQKEKAFLMEDLSLKGSSAWWHMCDLVWVLLFPVLYIL
ncbi:cytochrome c oxidase subunit 3 [Myxococcota bacterium]|nr:cytochrome c oxidase subunit 3 [Myxococcota bacterium]